MKRPAWKPLLFLLPLLVAAAIFAAVIGWIIFANYGG